MKIMIQNPELKLYLESSANDSTYNIVLVCNKNQQEMMRIVSQDLFLAWERATDILRNIHAREWSDDFIFYIENKKTKNIIVRFDIERGYNKTIGDVYIFNFLQIDEKWHELEF